MVAFPKVGGMVPVRLLVSRYKFTSFGRKPIFGGIEPARKFFEMTRVVKLEQFVNASVGIMPSKRFLYS